MGGVLFLLAPEQAKPSKSTAVSASLRIPIANSRSLQHCLPARTLRAKPVLRPICPSRPYPVYVRS